MTRSGYYDDCDGSDLAMWRGAVASAIRGRRGQAFLAEMITSLDALPDKRLGENALRDADGDFCALGCVGNARGLSMSEIDPEDRDAVAAAFGIAPAMAAEIMFENDDTWGASESAEERWYRMRRWSALKIKP